MPSLDLSAFLDELNDVLSCRLCMIWRTVSSALRRPGLVLLSRCLLLDLECMCLLCFGHLEVCSVRPSTSLREVWFVFDETALLVRVSSVNWSDSVFCFLRGVIWLSGESDLNGLNIREMSVIVDYSDFVLTCVGFTAFGDYEVFLGL